MSEKLKPCPFCGTDVHMERELVPLRYYKGNYGYSVHCHNCGCKIDLSGNDTIHHSDEEAQSNVIKAWNNRATRNSSSFFHNADCEYFPCHKTDKPENFSCMFCYCPLYHMAECPGNPEMLPNGIKDCTNCILPHYNYYAIINELRKAVIA